MDVKVKRLTETAKLPTRGSEQAAGYDLFADIQEPVEIAPHTVAKIGTGLAMEIQEGYFGAIFARSGISLKRGLRPANCVGICDSDYRGEYIVALRNDTNQLHTVQPQEKIAQLVILPFMPAEFTEVEELGATQRGEGGFGSSSTGV